MLSNIDDYEAARLRGDNAAVVEHGTKAAGSVTTLLGLIVGSRAVVSTRAIASYTLSVIDAAKYIHYVCRKIIKTFTQGN